jgi:hypothetical protein
VTTAPTRKEIQEYRAAVATCFDLAGDETATAAACETALRKVDYLEKLTVGKDRAREIIRSVAAEYEASTGTCPYCGGTPHVGE